MKKVVIVPDSFKGSLSSFEASQIIAKAVRDVDPKIETVMIPIADGGEGTIDVLGAKRIPCKAKDAFFQETNSYWGKLGQTAVIELAAIAGLPMAKEPDPMITTTFGVGELILNALDHGMRDFILALGGSSTNDMGCGMAHALGAKFFDQHDKEFVPTGGTLSRIAHVDLSQMDMRIGDSHFITMCDVTNPLYGKNGAAYVFAPQKGATTEMLPILDEGLMHAAGVVEKALGIDISSLPGAGAAGGCGAGSVAFLSSLLQSGIETILNVKSFEQEILDADFVITGEGRFDTQSLGGKALSGIASMCKKKHVPLIVLCGSSAVLKDEDLDGICAVFSIQREPCSLNDAISEGANNLYQTALQVMRLLSTIVS